MEYRHVLDPDRKERICLPILKALPEWFGDRKAVRRYAHEAREQFFLCAFDGEAPIGFLTVREHTDAACEITVMGVLPAFHRRGAGRELMARCARFYRSRGFRYLTVKTLADTTDSAAYVKTRAFYLSCGFEPLEIFDTLWDADNPCLYLVKPLFAMQADQPLDS